MASLDNTLTWGLAGALAGGLYYAWTNNWLTDLIPKKCTQIGLCTDDHIWSEDECKCVKKTDDTPLPGTSGIYSYYLKRKLQCRDNHMTFAWLVSQQIRVLNYKEYNNGGIYPAMCGAPGPVIILVAIDAQDAVSGSKLRTLGFNQYFAPPTEPNPNIPIPNPPANSNLAMTLAYVGQSSGHRAYRVYRHKVR